MAPPGSPARSQPPAWLIALVLALAVVVLYWPALQHGFVNYDDDRYLTGNKQVQKGLTLQNVGWAFSHPVADNWHPLTVMSDMLVCQFCQLDPWGHHLVNVLLHAANAALVFVFLRRLTGAVWKSVMVAALFAVHPLRVESVAWVAERKDVLSGLFGLLTLVAYAGYAQARVAGGRRAFWSIPSYWLAWLWFGLGLMSKPMLVTWPFVLLLIDYWPLGRFKAGQVTSLLGEKVPFFLLAIAASVITFLVQNANGVVETVQHLPLLARCETALISYCRYLGKIFWPADLAVFYPHPGSWPSSEACLAAVFLAAVLALALAQRRQHPYLLMGWLWFLGTLVPVLGLVQVGLQAMADRYTYLPSLGIMIVAVWGAEALTRRWQYRAAMLGTAGAAAIVACAIVTRVQLQYWQDGETLFRHTVAVTEDNYIALYNLGVALDEQGKLSEAIQTYESVVAIHPAFARAHVNLGTDLDKTGQTGAAIENYEEAIRLTPDNSQAHNNLGVALFKQGKKNEAIREFQAAVRLAPDNAGAHNSLAAALYNHGERDEGIWQFQEALRLDPDLAEAHCNYACVLVERGQTNEAILHFQETLRLRPDFTPARDGLAQILGHPPKSD
jgi:tetratricopeptide (TPR) repeat protein